jgi:hypothetical protein
MGCAFCCEVTYCRLPSSSHKDMHQAASTSHRGSSSRWITALQRKPCAIPSWSFRMMPHQQHHCHKRPSLRRFRTRSGLSSRTLPTSLQKQLIKMLSSQGTAASALHAAPSGITCSDDAASGSSLFTALAVTLLRWTAPHPYSRSSAVHRFDFTCIRWFGGARSQ